MNFLLLQAKTEAGQRLGREAEINKVKTQHNKTTAKTKKKIERRIGESCLVPSSSLDRSFSLSERKNRPLVNGYFKSSARTRHP